MMGKLKKILLYRILIALLILAVNGCFGQQDADLGSWNILNVKWTITEKWSVFGEAQIRSLKFYDDFHYHEYKAGVNFKAHANVVLTLAAGDYDTYKEGGNFVNPKNNDEFRIWPQIALLHAIGKCKIEQRYRSEFRFTDNGYRNRFRYRLGLSYPFGKKKSDFLPYQVGISNELFFTNTEPYFERNRLLLSLGRRMSEQLLIQAGYLHQFDYKINDETGRDFLQIGVYIDIKKKMPPRH